VFALHVDNLDNKSHPPTMNLRRFSENELRQSGVSHSPTFLRHSLLKMLTPLQWRACHTANLGCKYRAAPLRITRGRGTCTAAAAGTSAAVKFGPPLPPTPGREDLCSHDTAAAMHRVAAAQSYAELADAVHAVSNPLSGHVAVQALLQVGKPRGASQKGQSLSPIHSRPVALWLPFSGTGQWPFLHTEKVQASCARKEWQGMVGKFMAPMQGL
jgi:hypothetical protein